MGETDERFTIVGRSYKSPEERSSEEQNVDKGKKQQWLQVLEQLKGVPVISFALVGIIVLGCIFAELIINHDPSGFSLEHLNEAPNSQFYFGTDSLGRDIFSMIWFGGRVSITIGLLSMVVTSVIGILYGSISGIAAAVIDRFMMRTAEILSSVPSLLMIILIVSIMGEQTIFTIALVIGVTGWLSLARMVRSEVRQIRNSEYVLASRCMGGKFLHILCVHLIPNFLSAILFMVISIIGSSITMESTLSFLGLGLPVEVISWGSMLSLSNKALLTNAWWVILAPGAFMVVTLLCITNIGNYLRKENNKKCSNL